MHAAGLTIFMPDEGKDLAISVMVNGHNGGPFQPDKNGRLIEHEGTTNRKGSHVMATISTDRETQ